MNTKITKKERTLSFLDLLLIIAKRWKLIFFGTLSGMIFIILFSIGSLIIQKFWGPEKSYLPNVYTSTATILFDDESLSEGSANILSLLGQGKTPPRKAKRVELLIKATSSIDELIEAYGFERTVKALNIEGVKFQKQKLREVLKANFLVKDHEETNSVDISYTHYDARFAEEILIKSLEILEKKYRELSAERVKEMSLSFDENLSQVEYKINAKMKELRDFQKENNVIDPVQQMDLKAKILIQLELEIEKKRMQRNQLAKYQGWEGAQVLQLQKEIEQQELSYKIQKGDKNTGSQYNIPFSKLVELSPTFYRLKSELNGLETLYTQLKVQQQSNIMELNNKTSSFQIIEKPSFFVGLQEEEEPEEFPLKSGPSRGKLCILFTFALFFCLIILSFFLDFFQAIKQDDDQREKLYAIKEVLPSFRKRKLR